MKPLFALSGALLLCMPARAQGDAIVERAMKASIVEGYVTVQQGQASAQPLQQGAPLHEGDVVQTGVASRAEISMSDGSTLRLGEKTRLELRVAPPTGRAFAARLWLGTLWARVHKLLEEESFQIETENAVAGVRGTEFLVETSGGLHDDSVRVHEGAVEVRERSSAWTHRVEAGNQLSFRRGLRPEGPKPIDPAAEARHPLMRWVRENPLRAPDPAERSENRVPKNEKEDRERPVRRPHLFDRFRGR